MIVEWLMSVWADLVELVVGLFPDYDSAAWFGDFGPAWTAIVGFLQPLSGWVDLTVLGFVLSGLFVAWSIAFVMKLTMRGASHIPGVGGAG